MNKSAKFEFLHLREQEIILQQSAKDYKTSSEFDIDLKIMILMQSQMDVVWGIYGILLEISVWGYAKSTLISKNISVRMSILGVAVFSQFQFSVIWVFSFLPALHCDRIALAQSLARCCSSRAKINSKLHQNEAENVTLCPLTVLVYSLEFLRLFGS